MSAITIAVRVFDRVVGVIDDVADRVEDARWRRFDRRRVREAEARGKHPTARAPQSLP